MIDFRPPAIGDRDAVRNVLERSRHICSDSSFANLFLLRRKYNTLISVDEGFLFRHYDGAGSRRGYTFPLGAGDPAPALAKIEADSQASGRPLEFCLLTNPQKAMLEARYGSRLSFHTSRGDADYVYSARDLADLPGRLFQKKRNHVSRFLRAWGDAEFRPLAASCFADALEIERRWREEKTANDDSWEHDAIIEACANYGELGLSGAVLYAGGKPAAMTVASEIVTGVWDIHFEKAVGEFAADGAYAAINRLFASMIADNASLINREEDLNHHNLRKAKLSYHPQSILEKSHARLEDR